MTKVACLGECMIELREESDGRLSRSFGGDTLNTAVYLARLGVTVDYITALGDDTWSDELLAAWNAEGVGTQNVLRIPGRLPGLYIIQTDPKGERRFSYWRENAPVRQLFQVQEAGSILEKLADYDVLYFSGITLSLYDERDRGLLATALDKARLRGRKIAFDTNFRPRGWPDRVVAQAAFRQVFSRCDMMFASTEDLELLFGSGGVQEFLRSSKEAEVVLKLPDLSCRVISQGEDLIVGSEKVDDVVDTTAAGDSFAAAYMAARLSGADPASAARAGHRLAGQVVRYRGAIIPPEAMPQRF